MPATETCELDAVQWLFNMAPKEENESKEQIDHLLDFRGMLTKMCTFFKALQASGSTVVAVTDFLAEVEEAGGSWYLFFPKKFS